MAITREKKEQILNDLVQKFTKAKTIVFSDYRGLTVKDLRDLRTKLRENNVDYFVAKKTLIRLAAEKAGYKDLDADILDGPIGVAFGYEDEVAPAKLLHLFSKTNNNLELRGALMEGNVLTLAETKALALIPSKEELFGKIMYLVKSPVYGFHSVCNNLMQSFVRALSALKDKQESST